MHFFARIVQLEVRKDTDNLKASGVLGEVDAEVLADGVLLGEEALDECLIDDDYLRRSGRVLLGEFTTAQNGHADGIEKMRADAIPGGAAAVAGAGCGMALLNDALAPVVAFQWTVEGHADMDDTGQRREAIFDLAVKAGKPADGVASTSRIKVEHIAICGGDAEVLMLKIDKRFGHQDCAGQQNERHGRLNHDQSFLWQR